MPFSRHVDASLEAYAEDNGPRQAHHSKKKVAWSNLIATRYSTQAKLLLSFSGTPRWSTPLSRTMAHPLVGHIDKTTYLGVRIFLEGVPSCPYSPYCLEEKFSATGALLLAAQALGYA